MLDICGKPMIQRVYERVKKSNHITDVIVATTPKSHSIIKLCQSKLMKYFVGDENDILGRLYKACYKVGGVDKRLKSKNDNAVIVRIWGDCPLIDPLVIDETIKYYFDNDFNYVVNTGYPTGLNVAVISFGALQKAHRKIKDPEKRMWIHKYFLEHKSEYRVGEYHHAPDMSNLDWSVDEQFDLDFARLIYTELGENFHWMEVLKLLTKK